MDYKPAQIYYIDRVTDVRKDIVKIPCLQGADPFLRLKSSRLISVAIHFNEGKLSNLKMRMTDSRLFCPRRGFRSIILTN